MSPRYLEELENTYSPTNTMSKRAVAVTRKRCWCKAAVLVVILSCLIATGAVSAGGWSRDLTSLGTQPADQYVFKPFELVLVSEEEDHLYGLCVFVNAKPALAAIDGTETLDGEFYPFVALQVANAEHGEWCTVDSASNPGKISTLSVEAKRPSKSLRVNLDGFRPMIGKFKYGKIALKSGESAVFELEKLLPPKEDDGAENNSAKR